MLFTQVGAQTIDWYELVIVPEFEKANFLIIKVDSVGKKCTRKRKLIYCTKSEEAHDYKVVDLRKRQLESIKGASISWQMISSDSLSSQKFADKLKYKYLIDYDYDLMEVDKTNSSVIYLKLDFLLIDRITGNIMGRSMQYDLNDPFEPMELLIDELLDMNSSK